MTDNLMFGGFPPILLKGQKKMTEETKTRQFPGQKVVDISKILEIKKEKTPFLPVAEDGAISAEYLDQQPLEQLEFRDKSHHHKKSRLKSKSKSNSRSHKK